MDQNMQSKLIIYGKKILIRDLWVKFQTSISLTILSL
jgi:hypothetical protein